MNETKISPRQKAILDILSQKGPLSRSEISRGVSSFYPVSRATLIRDLNDLVGRKLVKSNGRGRGLVYSLVEQQKILSYIDLETYFQKEVDARDVKYENFNPEIFSQLKNLLTIKDIKDFDLGRQKFTHRLSKSDETEFQKELERFVIELSWKSSKIEGNTYTLLETEDLIKRRKEAIGHPKEEATMILNHKNAFDLIFKNRRDFQKISLKDIRGLHAELTKNLSIDQGLRQRPVGITGTRYQPPKNVWQTREAIEKLIKLLSSTGHPAEKSLIALALIAYIQPFADGNKRTSRMLSNAIFLAFDYYPLSYRGIDEVEYKKALIVLYEQNNLYHLKRLFLEQYRFAMENYFKF